MASYTVDILIALKGAQKLDGFNKQLAKTAEINDLVNKNMQLLGKNSDLVVRSFDSLNKAVSEAKKNFNEAAVGTSNQKKAAKELVAAQKDLNRELAIGNGLLKAGTKISAVDKAIARNARRRPKRDPRSGFKSFSERADELRFQGQSSLLPPRSPLPPRSSLDPGQSLFGQSVGGASDRARQILREEQALQEALGRMNQRFTGPGNITPMELTGQSVNIENRLKQALAKQTANRKKAELEIIKIRETADKKRKANRIREDQARIRTEQLIAQDRINQRGRIAPNVPTIGSLAGGFNLRSQFAEGGAFAATRGQRFRGAASNALIGGGFPLLFGQGAIGAAGGGIGGALGGALGGGFGFGLSITGTAIAQQIQQTLDFRKSIRELNKEMEKMGISSNISGSQVRQLGKSLGITKEEAVKALQEFKRFGNDAVLIAKKFGGDFGRFDALAQANTVESALSAIRKINKDLTLEDELRFILSVQRKGVEATINDILTESLEKQKELDTAGFGQGVGGRKRPKVLERERDQLKEINTENTQLIEKLTNIRDLNNEIRIASEESSYSIVKGLQDVNAEIRKLNSAQFQVVELSKTLGSAFAESFKGIIKGTMSVGEAFRSMFMRIADHFLDMAAQMMAAQISKGFMGLFGSLFNPFGATMGGAGYFDPVTGLGTAGPNFGLANGGTARSGRSYLVGENGPEIFTPKNTGTVIPNHELGGMGSSTNIVVNVDASGSNVQGDEEQGRELGRLISAAVQSEIIQQQRPGGLLA